MAESKKKLGRPATGVTPQDAVRMDKELASAVEGYMKRHEISRAEAIRRLVRKGLNG